MQWPGSPTPAGHAAMTVLTQYRMLKPFHTKHKYSSEENRKEIYKNWFCGFVWMLAHPWGTFERGKKYSDGPQFQRVSACGNICLTDEILWSQSFCILISHVLLCVAWRVCIFGVLEQWVFVFGVTKWSFFSPMGHFSDYWCFGITMSHPLLNTQ